MTIGFLAPLNGFKQYRRIYLAIITFLNKKGHEVVHPLSFNEAMVHTWSPQERIDFIDNYHAKVNKSDIVIAECSYPSISMGYEIANIVQQGKDVIILKTKDEDVHSKNFESLYHNKNIFIYEYQSYNLQDIIAEAISFNPNQRYKKYNILFTPQLVAKLNEIAKKKNLPKSVYIRQLIEKGIEKDI